MSRRSLVPALLVTMFAALAAAVPAAAQRDFADVKIEREQVAGPVWVLKGAGGNIGLFAAGDVAFLIDDQFAPLTEKILAAVREVTESKVRFLVNTHWHGDHTGGNENLGKAGVTIVAHDNVRARMSVEQFMKAFDRTVPAAPPEALPVITFADGLSFHLAGERIEVFHVAPAHTDGDSVIRFEQADVLHMGDVFFNGRYPFIDVSSGGSVDGVIAAVDRVLGVAGPATKIIPGHGKVGDRAALVAYRDMLQTVRDRVAAGIGAGQELDAVRAAKPTAEFDETWGDPAGFIGFVYESLRATTP